MTMCVRGISAMDSDVVETDEDILTSDVADDALERAAVVSHRAGKLFRSKCDFYLG
jgi:hypothetical protein